MSSPIQPRVLKGFRDFLPDDERRRSALVRSLEGAFTSFGFVPIDTPVLEYAEILLGKGGGETDKQVYRFIDHGERDVAMRYDLTVPFARFMAAHSRALPMPFKRYHIGKVWRGENTQRGRYREFMQCDFDIVGVDNASADFEIVLLVAECFSAVGIPDVTIEVSHRGMFNRFLERLGCLERSADVLRLVDKIEKIGADGMLRALRELVSESSAATILDYIRGDADQAAAVDKAERLTGGPSEDSERLRAVLRLADELGVGNIRFNPSITRGLDYYTGLVYETFLTKLRSIGSVCSGGRYNDLASLYTDVRLPGVGASVGLDRLIAALDELGTAADLDPVPQVLVLLLDERLVGYYHELARSIRRGGLSCEVYFEKRKLGQQFQYAEKKGIPCAVVCGEDERAAGTVSVKNLLTRESFDGLAPESVHATIAAVVESARRKA